MSNMTRTTLRPFHCALCILHCALSVAMALPTITVDKVAQRWPWNNKVDITYTVADGGLDLAAFQYRKIVFTANIGGTEYTIDGSHDVFAPVADGTYTVTWTNAPSGVTAPNSTMVATITDTEAYYMIIDLETGNYVFADLEAGDTPNAKPTASNARYNTAPYKDDYLVLRRVPRTSANSAFPNGYATGDDEEFGENSSATWKNTATNRVIAKDFFIGIFELTKGQYQKLFPDAEVNQSRHLPRAYYSWNNLRVSRSPAEGLGSNANSDSFFERLNAKTRLLGFDLPTEAMWEIAGRGGNDTWQYGVCGESMFWDVGSYALADPSGVNNWGIFDIVGNVAELCRDDAVRTDMGREPPNDALVPASEAGATSIMIRGKHFGEGYYPTTNHNRARRSALAKTGANSTYGFRVAFIAE